MSKRDLDRLKRQIEEEKQRFLASVPKEKRLKLERQMEIDVPPFMRDRDRRITKAKRKG
jgi:DNA repair photolyase